MVDNAAQNGYRLYQYREPPTNLIQFKEIGSGNFW